MATITAVRTGNWSDTSHVTGPWPGASTPTTQPGASDTAQTGNFVVTIDQDITVAYLESTGTGYFAVTAARNIAAAIITSHTTVFQGGVRISNASGTVAIIGSITGGSVTSVHCVSKSGNGALTISGNVTCGSAGNVALNIAANSPTVTITGSATGGNATGAIGVDNITTATVSISGSATGGSGISAYGARNSSTGSLAVGTAVGGTAAGAAGLYGSLTTGLTTFKIAEFSATGVVPVAGFCRLLVDATVNKIVCRNSIGDTAYELSNDYPAVAKVLDDTTYKLAALTGTYHAPSVGEVIDTAVFGAASGTAGTFAIPAEADVKDGVGYGEDGTEFEGTYVCAGGGGVPVVGGNVVRR